MRLPISLSRWQAQGLAQCARTCRRDRRLANLTTYAPGSPPPPADARGLCSFSVGWLDLLTLRSGMRQRMAYHRHAHEPPWVPCMLASAAVLLGGQPGKTANLEHLGAVPCCDSSHTYGPGQAA